MVLVVVQKETFSMAKVVFSIAVCSGEGLGVAGGGSWIG